MTQDNILQDVQVIPMIHVTIGEGDDATIRDFPWSDIAQEGDDPATISDDDLKARVERWMDIPEGTLAQHEVNRPQTGNVVLSAKAVFGAT